MSRSLREAMIKKAKELVTLLPRTDGGGGLVEVEDLIAITTQTSKLHWSVVLYNKLTERQYLVNYNRIGDVYKASLLEKSKEFRHVPSDEVMQDPDKPTVKTSIGMQIKMTFVVPYGLTIDMAMKPVYDAARVLAELGIKPTVQLTSVDAPDGSSHHWSQEGYEGRW